MDANFEMGPRWIFFTDGQFLTISREINYTRFAMVEKERGGNRKLPHQRKTSQGKVKRLFEILSLFLYKIFS